MKVGVISDTHGLLRAEALAALQGCERIIHAGDIGKAQILEQLSEIAPLYVVRGNNDQAAPWAAHIADHLCFELNGWQTLLVHDMADVPALLDARYKAGDYRAFPQTTHRMERGTALSKPRQRGAETVQAAGDVGSARTGKRSD
jgi:predicted phosphodiesterase